MNRKEIFKALNEDYPRAEVSSNPIGLFETNEKLNTSNDVNINIKGDNENGKSEGSNINEQRSNGGQAIAIQNDDE